MSKKINQAEIFVSQSLRVGVLLSATVIFCGLALFLIQGQSGYPGESYPRQLKDILQGAYDLKPFGIILTGLVLLISTPILRVGVSIMVFFKEKDWLYVAISSTVFFILLSSFLFGK